MIRLDRSYPSSSMALLLLALAFSASLVGAATAQTPGNDATVATATREASHASSSGPDRSQDRARQEFRQRIRGRIYGDPSLGPQDRLAMERNLDECLRLGLSEHQIGALFPWQRAKQQENGAHLLRMQGRVLDAAAGGASPDLVADKIAEGRRKGVDPERLDHAATRMAEHVKTAHREMARLVDEGLTRTGDDHTERHLEKGLALDMWRGLGREDVAGLGGHAMERARHRDCSTVDFAAAAETTTELMESGVGRERSRSMAGMALEQGYSAREIREIGAMVRASRHDGTHPPEEMLQWMERGLHSGHTMSEMMREMMEHGWMGPRDMYGAGCHSPVDDVIGGPGYDGDHHGGGGHGGGGHGSGHGGAGSGGGGHHGGM